jgi:hypothetical protein
MAKDMAQHPDAEDGSEGCFLAGCFLPASDLERWMYRRKKQ